MSSSRELNNPRSAREGKRETSFIQSEFTRGMIRNAPHEDLPKNSLANLVNAHAYPTEVRPRLGNVIHSSIQPPVLEGRTGYSAYKVGNVITSTSGVFYSTDVGNYFAWPGSPNYHDNIEEYISATQVRVRDSGDRDLATGCWLHAKLNLFEYHYSARKIVFQWGTEVYVADTIAITGITRVLCVSNAQPSNSISDWAEMDDYGIITNSNGIFIIDFSSSPAVMFRKNTPVPSVLVESNGDELAAYDDANIRDNQWRYVYSMSRLAGTGIRNRGTSGATILQESGTTALDPTTNPPRDYGINWAEYPVGRGVKTLGRLVGEEMAVADQRPETWLAITAGRFVLTINGETNNYEVNFGFNGANVKTMYSVADAIQDVLREVHPLATCEFSNGRMIVTSGYEDGSTIGFMTDGTVPNSIADNLMLREVDGATIDNSYSYERPQEIGILNVPEDEWHWTHYTLYRTLNLKGENPATLELNTPNKFFWVGDYRVGAAFLASRSSDNIVTSTIGVFEEADVGTPLVWEDGEVDTIYEYINSNQVSVNPSIRDYISTSKPLQACAIGGGEVIRASQSGHTVTRSHGETFAVTDVRKTIIWSDGEYSIITAYVDANTVTVSDSNTRVSQGITFDSVSRVVSDLVPDDDLRSREDELYVGLLGHRYWVPLPLCNLGKIIPNFLVVGIRGTPDVYYSQLGTTLKYLSGYYLEGRQKVDRIEDGVNAIWQMPNRIIFFCYGSTWAATTNKPKTFELPQYGESYSILQVDIVDHIGVVDTGSIRQVDLQLLEMRTSDDAWRLFDGYKFLQYDNSVDPETGQDRVKKDFVESQNESASAYNDTIGHVIWFRGN